MKLMVKIALVTGALALACGSAALAGQPEGVPKGKGPTYTPADPPKGGPPPKGKAYGHYCKGESKKHVKGEKGTAFSRCVKNMAQAAKRKAKPRAGLQRREQETRQRRERDCVQPLRESGGEAAQGRKAEEKKP